MTITELFERAKELGVQDYHLTLSQYIVVDEAQELSAVMDVPVQGLAQNDGDKEVRIVIGSANAKRIVERVGDKALLTPIIRDDDQKTT